MNQLWYLVFLLYTETIQHGYSQFGGKGISTYIYIYSKLEYRVDISSNSDTKTKYSTIHYSCHHSFVPANNQIFNCRM